MSLPLFSALVAPIKLDPAASATAAAVSRIFIHYGYCLWLLDCWAVAASDEFLPIEKRNKKERSRDDGPPRQ